MGEIIKNSQDFISNFMFSVSWGGLALGLFVLVLAIGILWEWKDTKPRDEKFWFACGILFHWWATINACSLFLLSDSHAILARTEHFLTGINRSFVIVAGTFYFRALSHHWKPNLWRWVLGFILSFIFTMYLYRIMV